MRTGLSGKLTLVSAPAGFGKTTLLAQWIPHSERCVSWLSLDEADNDLTRFLTYFITALQTLKADFGQAFLAALQAPQPPPIESLITVLINEIVQTLDEFALVLDDYHLLKLEAIHAAIAFLLNNLPPNMHLIIASRADPPLSLARLRVRGQLTELRAADLRFTPDEAAAFLNEIMGLNLSTEDIAVLETRTEGWIAGLQLAALSMQGRSDTAGFIKAFTGSHAYIVDYLAEEVLRRQPDSVQTFLLQTSILERMSGPLCDAVTGGDNGQTLLEKLQQNNLFIVPLDDKRDWYRYHHLFAEVLRQGLQRSLSAEAVAGLHHRASTWYKQAEWIDEAIHHALTAQAFDRAATLVEQIAPAMIQHSEFARLLIWLETLPEEEVQARPLLTLYHVWVLYVSGQINQAAARLKTIEAMLEADEAKRTPEVQGLIAAVQAWLLRDAGDLTATIALSRQALANLPEQDKLLRAMVTLNLAIAHYLQGEFELASDLLTQTIATGQTAQRMANTLSAIYLNMQLLRGQGSLQQALQLGQEGLALVSHHGWHNFPAVGFLYVAFGDLLRERNELGTAGEYLEKGITLGQAGGHPHILIGGHVWLASLRQTEGNGAGSQEAIRAALQLVQQHEVSRFWPLPSAACTQARLWIAQGNLAAASRWAETSGLDRAHTLIPYLDEAAYLTLARLRIAESKLEVAESLLLRLHQAAVSAGCSGSLIEILILQGVTYAARKQSEKAKLVLAQALSLAEPEGYIRVFVDEGTPVAELLGSMKREDGTRSVEKYVDKLLAAFGKEESTTLKDEEWPTSYPSSLTPAQHAGATIPQPLVEPSAVSHITRICTYDRAGAGWSEAGPGPRTSQQISAELHRLLANAGLPGPYVLAGHSAGALHIQVYAGQYPADVAGLVLVDPTPAQAIIRFSPEQRRAVLPGSGQIQLLRVMQFFGLLRFLPLSGDPVLASLPPATQAQIRAHRLQSGAMAAMAAEAEGLETSLSQTAEATPLPADRPLLIVWHGAPAEPVELELPARASMEEMVQQSGNGKFVVAENSGHFITFERPDVVIDQISQVVEAVRTARPLK